MQEIEDHASAQSYTAFLAACGRLEEARTAARVQQTVVPTSLQQTRAHIINEILTLHCPRCKAAFIDFDGCMALSCSRDACGAKFCAVCLRDCAGDADAHEHVRSCKYTEGVGLHASGDSLRRMHNRWRTDKIVEVWPHTIT